MQTMNAPQGECLRIDRSQRPSRSPPVENIPPAEISARAGGFSLPESPSESAAHRNPLRGRLIVIGFVAVAPIAIGAWLWLLGRIALSLL
jgi:hypothetical protein